MINTPITVKAASRKPPPCRTRLKEELKKDRDRARDKTLQALRGGHTSPGGCYGAEEEEPRPSNSGEVDARLNRISEQFGLDLSDPSVREDLLALEEEIWEELQVAYYRQLEELDDPCAYFEHLTQQ